jgi:hypothetical protein
MIEAERQKAIEQQKAKNAKQQLKKTRAFKRLFATDDGKILMKHLEWICNVNRSTYRPNTPNVEVETDMRIEEGKRQVHLDIIWYLNLTEKENGN